MPPPRRSARQLEEMIDEPSRALADSRYWTEPLCRRWLDHVADQVHDNPRAALPLAILGVRLARRVGHARRRRAIHDRCILARAFGVLGSVYRACGDHGKASRALEKASLLARRCSDPDDTSDILRRRAFLTAYQSQRSDGTFDTGLLGEALDLAERAVRASRGHHAQARALTARGIVRMRTEDIAGATEDGRHALDLLDPTEHGLDHAAALSVLISALVRGDRETRESALPYVAQLRSSLPPRSPALRARLLWAEALLLIPNRRRKARARKLLDQARRRFVRLEMESEAVAVTAELARLAPEGAVPELCSDVLAILGPSPIRDGLDRLRQARMVERVDLAERLRALVSAPSVLPAAAWPAP